MEKFTEFVSFVRECYAEGTQPSCYFEDIDTDGKKHIYRATLSHMPLNIEEVTDAKLEQTEQTIEILKSELAKLETMKEEFIPKVEEVRKSAEEVARAKEDIVAEEVLGAEPLDEEVVQ